MAEEYSCAFDVGTLLHNLLFSYQKAAKGILGSGQEVFYHPTIDLLLKIEANSKLKLVSAANLDEALANFSTFLVKAQVMKNFAVKKENGNYTVAVEGCVWANHVHRELDPKDVICPWAMIATALAQKFKTERMAETESKYLTDGSITV
ncbi:MAG: hypothetical protein M1167_02950, partial [Chloroflexi bacterium]|nr:hypothetical protein [Chloroflexota bacterium]